ncbi:helix-turn-helix protein [Tamaricihabitans halophyticus]|uniref:Helix-turn-helix protein n=1 Tax=Tamaricihabitans halophyticus TaxID=1262583 RepID=A0A4R2QCL1_9PSEU|nr:winged helix-turn-helix domain-containing protein [Tamaricihabitans halophyticus]TCP46773.1 helix-turn-helix protein [Tamaricihabitans halophyticus]
MLRIHFGVDDLQRVRVASAPDPLWELVLSVNKLQSPGVHGHYTEWRALARGRLRAGGMERSMGLLRTLVPARGNFPDFLTPWESSFSLEAGYESIKQVPADLVNKDLAGAFRRRQAPGWVRELADRRGVGMRLVVSALRQYHGELLRPYEDRIVPRVEADLAVRNHDLAAQGPVGLLRGLPEPIEWKDCGPIGTESGGVLEADYPTEHEVHLSGRGLTLVPSFFCVGAPVTLINGELPPVLVYPAAAPVLDGTVGSMSGRRRDHLAGLLGATRAHILRSLTEPRSTKQLAELVRVSSPAASQHLALLRGSGLVTSTRRGQSVLHAITRLGRDLIDQ